MTTRPRRLSPLDASFLAVESDTAPMHVGWAAVFSPSGDDARPTFEQLRDHIAARMGRAPRYRQRLARVPLGLQPPVWVDDEHFAVERHVRHDTSRDLAALAGAVMSEPLRADRPLWEIVIADRLADGRIGVIGKVHHCMVDGIAAVELAGLLNDLVLAATAGGVRRLMLARNEPATALKTMVPVNVRESGAESELGNRISFMFVDLPCNIAEPLERVHAVHSHTTELKQAQAASGGATVLSLLALAPPPVQAVISRATASRRVFNLTVSNVPGPGEPLWMRGCRLDAAFPVIPLADDHGVSVGMTTIAGRACFGVYADPVAVPDAALLATGIEEDLDELSGVAESLAPPRPTGRFTRSIDRPLVPVGD